MDTLTNQQILDADLADWRKLAQALHARFLTGDFTTGLGFVTAVTEAAEAANHHPDILVHGWNNVRLILSTHSVGGLTQADLDMARRLDGVA
jgi:4a-hydroxytetrahydrobiopterin dehydratase